MLEGLVRQAVPRFVSLEDDGRREEFRQLCRSFMRFYAFIAQVVTLDDPRLEKLYAYLSWLLKLLPDRDVPPDAVITDDMLDLKAFRIERKDEGSASLKPGDTAALTPISEFGAKPMTEDEAKRLSELVKAFNERTVRRSLKRTLTSSKSSMRESSRETWARRSAITLRTSRFAHMKRNSSRSWSRTFNAAMISRTSCLLTGKGPR